MAEANFIDASKVKGEKFTGYEPPANKGPFECGNCEYFRPGNSTCGQETMVAKSQQPLIDGRRKVEPGGCCEYVERVGRIAKSSNSGKENARSIFSARR